MDFWQAIHRLRQEFWCRVVVRVEFFVHGRALQTEVGAQVDHPAATPQQRDGEFGGHAMGQGQEDDLCLLSQSGRVGIAELQRAGHGVHGELGKHLSDGLSRALSGGDRHQFDLRMTQQQAYEFFTRIAGGSNDGDANGTGIGIHGQRYRTGTLQNPSAGGEQGFCGTRNWLSEGRWDR